MAEKILNTRILMKVDTLEAWENSSLKLKKGELAFATVAASAGTGLEEPVVMVKIGTDEEKTFSELPWAFHAKAADVLAACKTEAGLKAFIANEIAAAGIATDEAMQALAGRVSTAEGKITTLEGEMDAVEKKADDNATAIAAIEGRFGAETVAAEIATAIANLKLGETYAAKALEQTVADHVADTVAHVTTADKTKWNGALQASDIAAGAANGTIAVKGTDVAVTGLGSAAFTEASAYDASGAAATAESNAKAYAKEYADGLAGNYDAKGAAAAAEAAAKAHAEQYANGLAGNYDAAGAADDALDAAKAYVDGFTGGKTVAESINAVIANYSTTEQMNSAIATAKGEAVAHANGLNTAMDTRVLALEAIDHSHTFVESELNLIQAGDVAKWNAAEQNAKDYADDLDEAMDARVLALEAKFTGDDSVADQIADAVAAEAKLREDADKALQEQVTANADAIEDLDGELTRLTGGVVVSEAIETAVKAEADRAKGVEGGLETRLKAVEDTYATDEDVAGLQTQINTILSNPDAEGAINSINEFTQYINEHKPIAEAFRTDINKNAADIAAEVKRAGEAEAELQGAINGVAADLETLEGEVAKKAAQADLEALAGRVTTAEGEIDTLQSDLDTAEAAIDVLEGYVGDKKVSEQITDVTNPLAERIVELEKVDHSHANAAELDKIADGDKAKWDAKLEDVTAAADSGLKATKTGNSVAIEIDDSLTFIFDCGGAN